MQVQSSSPVPAVFSFESLDVRVVDRGGEPWFVANDVAAILGYADCKQAVRDHCKRSELLKGVESVPFTTSPRGITIIPEGDVFRLIVRSNLPTAEKFEAWVMDEVLPAIRKTGSYSVAPVPPADPMQALRLMFSAMEQTQQQVVEVSAKVDELASTVRLHNWQCYELKAAVTQKAEEMHKEYDVHYPLLFPAIWGFVKRHFRVPTYNAIPTLRFDEALMIVRGLTFEQMPDYVVNNAKGVAA